MYFAIVADIGGTNSRFQLYSISASEAVPVKGSRAKGTLIYEEEFSNEKFVLQNKTFADVFRTFITNSNHVGQPIHVASIAVAGPVHNNKVTFTNNGWSIDGATLREEMGIVGEVQLMNDFVANGYGLLTLDFGAGRGTRSDEEQDIRILQDVPRVPGAPIACVGAGTGLGEVYLTNPYRNENDDYTAYASEGGHAEYAPRTQLEFEMLQFLMEKFKETHRVSVERVVSGRGLAHIYEFLSQHPDYKNKADPSIASQFSEAGDLQGKVVAENVDNDPLCAKAMEIFVIAYGSEAGVAALKFLPYGGLFLAGGLTPKNLHHIEHGTDEEGGILTIEDAITRNITLKCHGKFLNAFRDKGRLSPVMLKIPVYAVMDQGLGQRGAHFIAVKLLYELSKTPLDETSTSTSVTTSTSASTNTSSHVNDNENTEFSHSQDHQQHHHHHQVSTNHHHCDHNCFLSWFAVWAPPMIAGSLITVFALKATKRLNFS
mmetsp:Transcript_150/g.182  ORF Transcript_150/g.182 Transcript_150/m.182 type:complete len:487 (+) Transcript_150:90-1550(+)